MNSHSQRNEQRLAHLLVRMIGLYQHSLKIFEEYSSDEKISSCAVHLQPVMKLIAELEPELKVELKTWSTDELRRRPRLRMLIREQESLLIKMLQSVSEAELKLGARIQQLVPAVDQQIQSQRVANAYQAQARRDAYGTVRQGAST